MRNSVLVLVLSQVTCVAGDDVSSTSETDASGPTTMNMSSTMASSGTVSTSLETTAASTMSTSQATTSADSAPFFISFSSNVAAITEDESVVFTAIMSDPDGFEDIAGGTLFTEDGGFSYGPFVSAGQEGTYSIMVSWAQIDQVESINFEMYDMVRTFRAEFFDKEGHSVMKDVMLTLHCDGGGACDGACRDLQNDEANCGACGKFCEGGCGAGMCSPLLGECIVQGDGFSTCDAYCQRVGEQCVESGCDGATFHAFGGPVLCMNDSGPVPVMEPCSMPQTWDAGRVSVRCCCSDTN